MVRKLTEEEISCTDIPTIVALKYASDAANRSPIAIRSQEARTKLMTFIAERDFSALTDDDAATYNALNYGFQSLDLERLQLMEEVAARHLDALGGNGSETAASPHLRLV